MIIGGRRHIIEIYDEQEKIEISEAQINLIRAAARTVLQMEEIAYDCEIEIDIIDNETIREINSECRNKDVPTDVLSFPLIDADKLPRLRKYIDDGHFDEDIDPDNETILMGNIVISAEKALEQSISFNQSFERELAFLTIHAVLHLLGYDHELSEKDDIEMRAKQKYILGLVVN